MQRCVLGIPIWNQLKPLMTKFNTTSTVEVLAIEDDANVYMSQSSIFD